MAVQTYGEPGKNPFAIKGVGGILSNVVNANTGVIQVYRQGAFGKPQSLGTIDPKTSKFTADKNANLSSLDIKALSDPTNIKQIKGKASETVIRGVQDGGGSAEQAKAISNKLITPNAAQVAPTTNPPGGNTSLTPDQQKEFQTELSTIKGNTRGKYDLMVVYPIGLDATLQDCIKFSIIEYKQSGLTGFTAGDQNLRRIGVSDANAIPKPLGQNRRVLSTIVLPIPGGIQDGNPVNWSGLNLPDVQQALGKVMATGIMGGNLVGATKEQLEAASAPGSGARTAIVSQFMESVLGDGGIMQRQFGTIINPNLELLFNSPELRTFNFSFKLSPRSSKEAVNVKKIIRYFKQAMSVKRSKSSMLLQTPHTFAISYIFQNKEHPYLNKFKECALTNCSVNYTPEGNYMSFDDSNEPSMVSYQLDLQFQEIEPIYDDDYTASDSDKDTLIGY